MSIEVQTYRDRFIATTSARVHFGLTVCGDVIEHPILGPTLYGGGGASIDRFHPVVRADSIEEPGLEIAYEPTRLDLPSAYYMSDRTRESLAECAGSIYSEAVACGKLGDAGVKLTVLSSAPEHIGLGSKTS